MKDKNVKGIWFDFDGTLIKGYMQTLTIFSYMNINPHEFWKEVLEYRKIHNTLPMITYLEFILEYAKLLDKPLTDEVFVEISKNLTVDNNVIDLLDKIKREHPKTKLYILSSGNYEILDNISIKGYFHEIVACKFGKMLSNSYNYVEQAIDRKLPYLLQMMKNSNITDVSNIAYIGDGYQDKPCLEYVDKCGGTAIHINNKDGENPYPFSIKRNDKLFDDKSPLSESLFDFLNQ